MFRVFVALDAGGNLVGAGDVKAQTRHVLEAIKAVLEAAGGSLDGHYLQPDFPERPWRLCRNERGVPGVFPADPPARYCIRADLVKPEFLVEIASTAHIGD